MSQLAGARALLAAQQATSHMVHCFLLDPAYAVTLLKQLKRSAWLWWKQGEQPPTASAGRERWKNYIKVFNLVTSYSEKQKASTVFPFMP